MPPTLNLCTILSTPHKGLGVFALQAITPGTVLLHDKPILRLERGTKDITASQLKSALSHLSSEDHDSFLSLHENNLPYHSRQMRIYKSNCFGDAATSWLSLKFSRVNHSCVPNAEITGIDSPAGAEVVAIKRIGKEEEVCISYLGPGDDGRRDQRRELLKATYGFECDCRACGLAGEEGWMSDVRRGFVAVLAGRQMGIEIAGFRELHDVNDAHDTIQGEGGGEGVLSPSYRPLAQPLAPAEKVQTNYLLALLLEAEGLINYRLAQAWVHAAVALMGQMQDLKPLVVLPAAQWVRCWLERARGVMRLVRCEGARDVLELEGACGVLTSCSYMVLARKIGEEERKRKGRKDGERYVGGGKGKKARTKAGKNGKVKDQGSGDGEEVFAIVFGQTNKRMTQRECIEAVRRMKGGTKQTREVVIEDCDD